MRWQAQTGVNDHGYIQALSQRSQRVRVDGAFTGPYGRGPRHHCLTAHINQALTQHQVVGGVRQHLKARFDECTGGRWQVDRVWLQGVVIAYELKFYPVSLKHFSGHFSGGNGFLKAVTTGRIGQHGHIGLA